jgi:RNA polymerase sigma factor (sigma-70 family)
LAGDPHGGLERQIRLLWAGGVVAGLADSELIERFLTRDGEISELAFAALVGRHGPMVMRTCRGIVHDDHAAEDAFQATFLVLARKAAGLRPRATLGPWLHAAALRVSMSARSASNRRRRKEREAAERSDSGFVEAVWDDRKAIVHDEIGRLPERFRAAVVMCDLEGLTTDEAASQLGWPVGTVRSRLSRGRDRLRARFVRRGLGPEAGAVVLARPLENSLLQPFIHRTARLALDVGLNRAALESASLISLMKGALFAMFLTKLKHAAVLLTMTLLLATGAGVMGWSAFAANRNEETSKKVQVEQPDTSKADTAVAAKVEEMEEDQLAWKKFVAEEIEIETMQGELESLRNEARNLRDLLTKESLKPEPLDDKARAAFETHNRKLRKYYDKTREVFRDQANQLLDTKRKHHELLPRFGEFRLNLSPRNQADRETPDEPISPALEERLSGIEGKLDTLIGKLQKP